ncbi:Methyltransf_7 domain-containing protein [Cephalotus follicularis]|uniref:Methyltransf_7 domain-containing protein n=1 Tax=Cephalotus follicularis TaxID=3775 RepID=A0A1Q3CA08_CEPFO|nr:Methyltransf_7 domain-containing protein [Cephalotus follicularis]
MSKAKPVLEETIMDQLKTALPTCFKVADLGCSSGPTTFSLIRTIIETVDRVIQRKKCRSPEFQVFLNDLPGNDFNTIFKSLPSFLKMLANDKGDKLRPCFITGVPGSFYGRLFPSRSLHFIHSSYSVHFLSKVPNCLENNKGNIYITKTSPPDVYKAYFGQFQEDFSMFLSLRSEEMKHGGRMVLTLIGRNFSDPTRKDCCYFWELLAKSLTELVAEGLVEEDDMDSFNLPFYAPFSGEVREIIQKEGSFSLDKLQTFEVNWDPTENDTNKTFAFNNYQSRKNVADCIRAVTEPMLASHFGDAIIDYLFEKYEKHVGEHLCVEKPKFFNIVIVLAKK